MKPLMPKQHGAWAMLILPFALGMEAGSPNLYHLPLLLGWVLLYLATFPILMAIKRRSISPYVSSVIFFLVPALLCLCVVLWKEWRLIFFGILMVPFFLVNVYFARKNRERSLLNDVSAVGLFGVGGVASYFLGVGYVDLLGVMIWSLSLLFFIGSILFVKTMIREKDNMTFRRISWGYHLALTIGFAAIGSYWLSIAFLPSTIRAIVFYKKTLTMMAVGIIEIVNSVFFLLVVLYFL